MKKAIILLGLATFVTAACTNDPQTQRQLECGAGVVGGAAVGGILGNQLGKGTGQDIATAVGAGAGAAAGTRLPACQ